MPQISYTFLRNNHTKQGRISTWTREQPGTTRKEKMMGDYTEHLISMAGGDGDEEAAAMVAKNKNAACNNCGGGVGEFKATAWRKDIGTRYFCHNDTRSCYNDCRGSYFA